MADETNKCAHEMCVCTVGGDDEYCSEFCKESSNADMTTIKCDCGHPGCDTV